MHRGAFFIQRLVDKAVYLTTYRSGDSLNEVNTQGLFNFCKFKLSQNFTFFPEKI